MCTTSVVYVYMYNALISLMLISSSILRASMASLRDASEVLQSLLLSAKSTRNGRLGDDYADEVACLASNTLQTIVLHCAVPLLKVSFAQRMVIEHSLCVMSTISYLLT